MPEQILVDENDWHIDLFSKTATHRPTGLAIRFTAALDGSGAMTADLLNPERLRDIEEEAIMNLPLQAWQVYAEHAERALAQEGE
ncbi:MAG: hypothetical protein HQL77_02985 [Magnetococcales bacterium]|nr:hypothetical protein [Magnetococcales bacterium]MBF0434320.1 hypothetical protein [Magnetococcales bacterium]